MLNEANDQNFSEVLKLDAAVVDFFSPTCTPCRALHPHFEALAEKTPEVKFFQYNSAENYQEIQKYNIHGVPALIGFINGKEVGRSVGWGGDPTEMNSLVEKLKQNSQLTRENFERLWNS